MELNFYYFLASQNLRFRNTSDAIFFFLNFEIMDDFIIRIWAENNKLQHVISIDVVSNFLYYFNVC